MRYVIRGKFWGFGKDFYVHNQYGIREFYVHCAPFSWAHKLSLQDMQGNEIAFVSQKFWSLRPHYALHRDGKRCAVITQEYTWFKKRFLMDSPGTNGYRVEGGFWGRDLCVKQGESTVATATLPFFAMPYTCDVDIDQGEDVVAILALCLIVIRVLRTQESTAV